MSPNYRAKKLCLPKGATVSDKAPMGVKKNIMGWEGRIPCHRCRLRDNIEIQAHVYSSLQWYVKVNADQANYLLIMYTTIRQPRSKE